MDVDGVLRETSGDQETVKVVARDKGDVNEGYQGHEKREDTAGGNLTERVVIDPKRKRIEKESLDVNNGLDTTKIAGPQNVTGPKNLDTAGLGVQARQTS